MSRILEAAAVHACLPEAPCRAAALWPIKPRGEHPRMNVSPLDLRQQRFRTALRGFDRSEVTSFLLAAADDYEQALHETDRMRQELARFEAALNEHREDERTLKTALVAAQKLAEDIKANAEEEARRILRDARARSELMLEKAQARLEEVQREIDALTLNRREAETSIEATLETLRHTLVFIRQRDRRRDVRACRGAGPGTAEPLDASEEPGTDPVEALAAVPATWEAPEAWRA
jgi:cell division initiation protein